MKNLNDDHLLQISKACIKLENVSLCFDESITDEGIIKSFYNHCPRLKFLFIQCCERVKGICITQLPSTLKSLTYRSITDVC